MFQKLKNNLIIGIAALSAVMLAGCSSNTSGTITIAPPANDPTGITVDGDTGNIAQDVANRGILSGGITAVNILMAILIGAVVIALIRNIVQLAVNGDNPNRRQDAIHNIIYSLIGIGIIGGAWTVAGLLYSLFQ